MATFNLEELETQIILPCRLCANNSDKIIGIYSSEGISNDLPNKMNQHLPIQVSETDTLPLQCCLNCASTLLAWHEFSISCAEAERKLQEIQTIELKVLDEETEYQEEHIETEDIELDADIDVRDDGGSSQEETMLDECSEAVSLNVFRQTAKTKEAEPWLKTEDIDNIAYSNLLSDDKTDKVKDSDSEMYNYMCEFCPSAYDNEEEIIKHVKEKHEIEFSKKTTKKARKKTTKIDQTEVNAAKVVVDGKVYYNCKECGKSLHSPYTYIWHMRIHTGERPFVCDLCGKQFRVSQGLVRHLKETHAGIKNFPCDICGRMFSTRRNVEEHRRIHTNERPYICDLCGKAFKQKASLFVHNRSHTNTFPYRCSYCNQGFRTRPPLLIHVTRHTGEKPYPCEVCGRCFRIKYELKRHMLIHSDEKPFTCAECGLSFRQKRYLRNHTKINHNRQTVT